METFDFCLPRVLKNEGGLSENPNDLGGITNYGISLRFLKSIPEERLRKYGIYGEFGDYLIRDMTVEQAKNLYRGEFWEQANFFKIKDLDVCAYIFDACVHHGISWGIKIAQRACWSVFQSRMILQDDGILGVTTIEYINKAGFFLLSPLRSERAGYCRLIVVHVPTQADKLEGWLNRCYGG